MLMGILALLLIFLITAVASCSKSDNTPNQEIHGTTTEPAPQYGWMEEDGRVYYVNQDGSRPSGWLDVEGKRYLLDEEGYVKSGWYDENGITYYIKEDGAMATGTVTIDGANYHFTSAGVPISTRICGVSKTPAKVRSMPVTAPNAIAV